MIHTNVFILGDGFQNPSKLLLSHTLNQTSIAAQ
jgi:hypothetical protein